MRSIQREDPGSHVNANPIVSVIIPTLGRSAFLAVVLRALFEQTYSGFEIIVIDQSGTISPLEDALKALSPWDIQWIHDAGKGAARARNIGLKNSRGGIIVGLEDDLIIPRRTLIEKHVQAYADPTIGGVSGRVIETRHRHNRGRVGSMRPLLCVPTGQGDGVRRQFIQTVKGGNMSFRKAALERVGGFDERFGPASIYEETDVSLKVRRLGFKILFEPEAEVIHLSAPTGGQRSVVDPRQFRFVAYRDRVLLFRNNYPAWRFPIFLGANLLAAFLPAAKMDWRSVELALTGLMEGLRLFGSIRRS